MSRDTELTEVKFWFPLDVFIMGKLQYQFTPFLRTMHLKYGKKDVVY